MGLTRRLLACSAGIVVSVVSPAGAPLVARAATVADEATILNGSSCALASPDDTRGACQFVQNSVACSVAKATLTCDVSATLTEPGGDQVGLSYKLTGTLIGSDIFVLATVVTGTASDDGATLDVVGEDSGGGCQVIDCGITGPVVLTLLW